MEEISQRQYALDEVSRLRHANGIVFCDVNEEIELPFHGKFVNYLAREVSRPLEAKFKRAYEERKGLIAYVMYSEYAEGDRRTIAFSSGMRISPYPNMPHSIEWGLHDLVEAHRELSQKIELILYVKALEEERGSPLRMEMELAETLAL
jgi:hypothetical protein